MATGIYKLFSSSTFLLRQGAEVGVAGLGHGGSQVWGTTRGRPALRQALHGPGLHPSTTRHSALWGQNKDLVTQLKNGYKNVIRFNLI